MTKMSFREISQDIQIKYYEIMSRLVQSQRGDYKKEIIEFSQNSYPFKKMISK